jgi:hypothetical protein
MRPAYINPEIELITVREASARSGWSPGHIRALAACGKLDCDRGTGAILIDADCLAILMRARASHRRRPQLRLVVNNSHL